MAGQSDATRASSAARDSLNAVAMLIGCLKLNFKGGPRRNNLQRAFSVLVIKVHSISTPYLRMQQPGMRNYKNFKGEKAEEI